MPFHAILTWISIFVVSMFMLSFIFLIACGFVGWKGICTIFFIVCLYLFCCWKSNYQGREDWDPNPIKWFTPATFLCLSQPGSGYPTPHIVVLFVSYDLRWEVTVCFVDIGGILKPAQIFKSSMFSRTVSLLYSGSGLLNLSFHQQVRIRVLACNANNSFWKFRLRNMLITNVIMQESA